MDHAVGVLFSPWFWGLLILAALVAISMLSRLSTGVRHQVPRELLDKAHIMLRGCNKWALAAKQDSNALMALMHVCYAKAYAETLRRLVTDQHIKRVYHVDMGVLQQKLDALEHSVLAKLSREAPALLPNSDFAIRIGWLE